jgi:acyl-CoA dehydrogenase
VADFSIDPAFAEQLDWIRSFVGEQVEPVDLAFAEESVIHDKTHPVHEAVLRPLQEQVRERGLWSCHLGPELGGQGYGQVRLAYMNEILGCSAFAPSVFGCQAPNSGNHRPAGGPWPSEHLPDRQAAARRLLADRIGV